MTIVFSKANRRQLITVDLVFMLLTNIRRDNFKDIEDMEPINASKENIINIFKALSPEFPNFIFTKKDLDRLNKMKQKLSNLIKASFDKDGVTLDIVNAVILLSEKAYQGSLKTNNIGLQKAWESVLNSLFKFYEQIDPDFKETSWMRLGTALSQNIEQIIQV